MINQQLLDYIRQQVTAGTSKESIKQALSTQGWSEQDVNEGFATLDKNLTTSANHTPAFSVSSPSIARPTKILDNTAGLSDNLVKSIWNKGIPRTNSTFMVISLVLVFGLDLFIAITSPDLRSFWYMMLAVFAVFAVFFCLENFVFRKKFANTTSSLDKWISMIIVIRNLIFLLNFIPFIQLLGLALLGGFLAIIPGLFGSGSLGLGSGFGGLGLLVPAMVVIYIILIISRYSTTKNQ